MTAIEAISDVVLSPPVQLLCGIRLGLSLARGWEPAMEGFRSMTHLREHFRRVRRWYWYDTVVFLMALAALTILPWIVIFHVIANIVEVAR